MVWDWLSPAGITLFSSKVSKEAKNLASLSETFTMIIKRGTKNRFTDPHINPICRNELAFLMNTINCRTVFKTIPRRLMRVNRVEWFLFLQHYEEKEREGKQRDRVRKNERRRETDRKCDISKREKVFRKHECKTSWFTVMDDYRMYWCARNVNDAEVAA